jgi:membrane dipeptidase
MIVIDAHLDLSWNALNWNRDLAQEVAEIRKSEAGMEQRSRGNNTVSLPALRRGQVAICLATVLARTNPKGTSILDYRTQEIASAMAHGQLAYYRILESRGLLRQLDSWPKIEAHFQQWSSSTNEKIPLGYLLSMEGADPILMEELGVILDATHLADEAFWQAMKCFRGSVIASHNNCRALVPGDRQFTDDQIRCLIERDAVIGAAFDNWMLCPGWISGQTPASAVSLESVIDHIDHVCELSGNSRHAAIGSDLDGGFGTEQSPHDLDTIADLQKIPPLLRKRGYSEADVQAIMHGNWLRVFKQAWGS